ncbi:hypothetical protein [Marivita sp. XM-24bin2]|jgi:hypothetical protein|uniref:hypothetical protein n=1 Tax=unclassified Marivita TaxID=2632480 RepID=UPI000D7B92E7|nr:hypothetical protein [Marivita sp. XM-24bin2]MCR9110340.1 hypothetical protein [Paracoccaceae bacterium]PWL34432.1 MAG: hypothetical protein DCO97_14390 [Marivita sp. XM-24bin2]
MSIYEPTGARRRNPFYSVPVLGWVVRDLKEGGPDTIYYLLVALFTLLVLAVMQWGVVALTMTALALVPVVMLVLILITVGK